MMRTPAGKIIGVWSVGWLLLPGCVTPGPTPQGFSVRRIERQDPAAVFDAAEATLVDSGYRIDQRDRASGALSGVLADSRSGERATSRGMRLSAPRPRQTVAYVHIERTAVFAKVYCKVVVQEQITEAHRMVARELGGLDTPRETPIERDAATTTKQNTVWRTVRRDRVAERSILSRILDLCGAGGNASFNSPVRD